MCGIIGYTGPREPVKVLLQGLKKLEYRGYDSTGIALAGTEGIAVYKTPGKVQDLTHILAEAPLAPAMAGIGHTRWATHGAPTQENAHPHGGKRVVLVHNGIIENHEELRRELAKNGVFPQGETDTEAAALYLDFLYEGDPFSALRQASERFRGAFALAVIFADRPRTVYALRRESPLVIGAGNGEQFVASDLPALLEYTRNYYLPENEEIAVLNPQGISFTDLWGNEHKKEQYTARWEPQSAQKRGYPHFMLKEIHEQPKAVADTLSQYLKNGALFSGTALPAKPAGRIFLIGCGSAYHAALMGKEFFRRYAGRLVCTEIAGEFRYGEPLLTPDDLAIFISQSGETADTLAALRLVKEKGTPTLGIVNTVGSSLEREADFVLYTAAGPEISVATTKAYTCQVVILALLALYYGNSPEYQACLKALTALPRQIEDTLKQEARCREWAKGWAKAEHLFFIGRGADYAACCEASLKLKEISYIHSEAYPAGELKHGTISLIEEGTPVAAFMTQDTHRSKTEGNVREVCARGAKLFTVTTKDAPVSEAEHLKLEIPSSEDFTAPLLGVILAQLLAYYTATERGNDVDQPRNLAKSVTVE